MHPPNIEGYGIIAEDDALPELRRESTFEFWPRFFSLWSFDVQRRRQTSQRPLLPPAGVENQGASQRRSQSPRARSSPSMSLSQSWERKKPLQSPAGHRHGLDSPPRDTDHSQSLLPKHPNRTVRGRFQSQCFLPAPSLPPGNGSTSQPA